MPFFSEVLGFHNWVYFAYLMSHRRVTYTKFIYARWLNNPGGNVSYVLQIRDPRKCH